MNAQYFFDTVSDGCYHFACYTFQRKYLVVLDLTTDINLELYTHMISD